MDLSNYKIKKQSRYDLIKEISEKMGVDIKKNKIWLGRLKDIDDKDIIKILQSANALARDKGIPFPKSWNWHLKEILK